MTFIKNKFTLTIFSLLIIFACKNNDKNSNVYKGKESSKQLESIQNDSIISVNLSYQVDNKFGKIVAKRLTGFLNNINDNKRWREYLTPESKEFSEYPISNLMSFRFSNNTFIDTPPTLLSIFKIENDTIAKIQFSKCGNNNTANILATVNIGIKRIADEIYFCDFLSLQSNGFKKLKVNNINYFYKGEINTVLANQLDEYNDWLSKIFNTSPKKFKYFILNNPYEIYPIQGLDYRYDIYSMYPPFGLTDSWNNIIFSGTGSEIYKHEVGHLYIKDLKFANNSHPWFKEGITTYFGGSRGKSLDWHLKELKKYLDLKTLKFEDPQIMPVKIGKNSFTGYIIGGLICKIVYEKNGLVGIEELFKYGGSSKNFYEAIDNVLGIKQKDLGEYITRYLESNYADSQYTK